MYIYIYHNVCIYIYTLYHIYKNIDNITHFDCSLGHSLTSSDLRNIREPNISMEITRFKTGGGYGQSEVELVIPAHFFIRKIIEVRTPHFWYSATFTCWYPSSLTFTSLTHQTFIMWIRASKWNKWNNNHQYVPGTKSRYMGGFE